MPQITQIEKLYLICLVNEKVGNLSVIYCSKYEILPRPIRCRSVFR